MALQLPVRWRYRWQRQIGMMEGNALRAHRKNLVGDRRGEPLLDNAGGFTPDGREVHHIAAWRRASTAPWVNVLANSDFGCVAEAEEATLGPATAR